MLQGTLRDAVYARMHKNVPLERDTVYSKQHFMLQGTLRAAVHLMVCGFYVHNLRNDASRALQMLTQLLGSTYRDKGVESRELGLIDDI